MSFLYTPKEGFAPSPELFRALSPICARVDRYKLLQNSDVGDMGVLANEAALRTGDSGIWDVQWLCIRCTDHPLPGRRLELSWTISGALGVTHP